MDPVLLLGFQGNEILFIVLLVVLLFGAAAIPKLAKALGRAQGEFKKARSEFDKEVRAGEADATRAGAAAVRAHEAAVSPEADTATAPAGGGEAAEEEVEPPSEEAVRAAARDMGIDEAGMDLAEVRRELDRRLG